MAGGLTHKEPSSCQKSESSWEGAALLKGPGMCHLSIHLWWSLRERSSTGLSSNLVFLVHLPELRPLTAICLKKMHTPHFLSWLWSYHLPGRTKAQLEIDSVILLFFNFGVSWTEPFLSTEGQVCSILPLTWQWKATAQGWTLPLTAYRNSPPRLPQESSWISRWTLLWPSPLALHVHRFAGLQCWVIISPTYAFLFQDQDRIQWWTHWEITVCQRYVLGGNTYNLQRPRVLSPGGFSINSQKIAAGRLPSPHSLDLVHPSICPKLPMRKGEHLCHQWENE